MIRKMMGYDKRDKQDYTFGNDREDMLEDDEARVMKGGSRRGRKRSSMKRDADDGESDEGLGKSGSRRRKRSMRRDAD